MTRNDIVAQLQASLDVIRRHLAVVDKNAQALASFISAKHKTEKVAKQSRDAASNALLAIEMAQLIILRECADLDQIQLPLFAIDREPSEN
jgi:hypothetical protein